MNRLPGFSLNYGRRETLSTMTFVASILLVAAVGLVTLCSANRDIAPMWKRCGITDFYSNLFGII